MSTYLGFFALALVVNVAWIVVLRYSETMRHLFFLIKQKRP